MLQAHQSKADQAGSIWSRTKRFTVSEYHQWIESGLLTSEHSLELLEGLLVEKMPIDPPHSFTTNELRDRLSPLLPEGYFMRSEQPITLPDSEPEPDGSIIRGKKRAFVEVHPGPTDIALVIEVSDSTLATDQKDKLRIYARAGIPLYWIVNLVDRRLEVFSEPVPEAEVPTYRHQTIFTAQENVPVKIDNDQLGSLPLFEIFP